MSFEDLYLKPKTVYYSTEDTSFVSGDSPVTLDVKTALGGLGNNGYIACDGNGDILVSISSDGTNYGSNIRVQHDEIFSLSAMFINKIKITHSGNDSAYRVFCE